MKRLLPIFAAAVRLVAARYPDLQVAIPTTETAAATVRDVVADWSIPVGIVQGERAKFDAFAASDVALAASGTVALELAMAKIPAV